MQRHPPSARAVLTAAALLVTACGTRHAGDPCNGQEPPVCETAGTRLACTEGRWVSEACASPEGCVPEGGAIRCSPPDAGSSHPQSDVYPGPHPAYPQVLHSGGTVLAAPRVQLLTFASDAPAVVRAAEGFTTALGASAYWREIGQEYGVGPLVAAPPLHLTEPAPRTVTNEQVQQWLAAKLDGGVPGLEPPGANTVYAVVYPQATVVDPGCDSVLAFHSSFTFGTTEVPYVVVARCPPSPGATAADAVTSSLSHELIEAATDPFPYVRPGYFDVDADHAAWSMLTFGEVSDLCGWDADWLVFPSGLNYGVARSWSNANARAGKNPCVPAPAGEVYFAAVPELNDPVTFQSVFLTTGTTKGVRVPLGGTTTVPVHLFSEAPTEDWSVWAVAYNPSALFVSLDRSLGNNGDVFTLTLTAYSNDAPSDGLFWISSSRMGVSEHRYQGLAGQ